MNDYSARVTYTLNGKTYRQIINVKASSKTQAVKAVEKYLNDKGATNIDVEKVG